MSARQFRILVAHWFCLVLVFIPGLSSAQSPQVALAGFAYSGDFDSQAVRFPFSVKYVQTLKDHGISVHDKVRAALAAAPARHIEIISDQIGDLKGRDQAIVVALVVTSETVSVEQFGVFHKLLVLVRGQAMFFDFKSKHVLRAYPLSFAVIDSLDHAPTEAETLVRVARVYEGSPAKPGIFTRFAELVAQATIAANQQCTVRVASVTYTPEALSAVPDYLKGKASTTETWAADMLAESISSRVGIPIVPYAKGYAIGNVMSVRIADGEVFALTLPVADYAINVEMSAFKKIKYSEVPAGASYIYGSFATVHIEEPMSGTVYMHAALKNGEVKVVPASQVYVDDFPAFYDSLNGLFAKLGDALGGKGNAWIKPASGAPDIDIQVSKTQEKLNQCK